MSAASQASAPGAADLAASAAPVAPPRARAARTVHTAAAERGSAQGGAARAARSPWGALWAMHALAAGALLLVLLAASLAGCGLVPPKRKPEPPVARQLPPPAPRTDGAIYQAGQQMELFADLKARRVGDVLTIRLTETTSASKSATTKTAKTTSVGNTGPTLFGRTPTTGGVPIGTVTLAGADAFDGEGSATQGNSLAGSITVTVMDVQSNGNLVVQGDKTLRLNQGDEYVHVSGVVRRADIATDNSITSDKVADAHISYSGKGVIDASNKMGWLARFFNSQYAPY